VDTSTLTGFSDKTGRKIHIGDVVQHRLGKFGKSGGTKNFTVINVGKKYKLVEGSLADSKYGGVVITEKICEYLVVIDSKYPRL
jgi:hypothetical protein